MRPTSNGAVNARVQLSSRPRQPAARHLRNLYAPEGRRQGPRAPASYMPHAKEPRIIFGGLGVAQPDLWPQWALGPLGPGPQGASRRRWSP
eukprot:2775838-Pyramimonas_sp.AAC.2